ncbi:MAG: O-antigen ligase family protein [Bacteroidetes bacterium]|nr:O-antigen ligase family protein [Bacteroidota bacterium]
MLKGLVSVLLIAVAIVDCLVLNEDLRTFIKNKGFKKTIVIILLLVAYLSLTLTYSSNPAYGFQKILNFLISVVPSVIVFYYLISTLTKLRVKLFVYSLGIISVLTVSYILTVYPFDQSTIYEYRAGRWSHVIYGRMISSFAVILLLYMVAMIGRAARLLPKKLYTLGQVRDTPRQLKEERPRVLFLMFITSIAIYGTYLSAFRAGFIGVLLVGIGLLLISIKNKVKSKNILNPDLPAFSIQRINSFLPTSLKLFLPFIIAAILIFTIPAKDIITLRFDNMVAIDNLQFKGDPAIHSRLEAWELSWEIIKEHPIIGSGFGGFNGYNNIEWTKMIKYPHNIILEMTAEGGVIGLLILILLIYIILSRAWKIYPGIILFLLFAIWLALFSKDLSSQAVLWIGLGFYGLKRVD